MIDAVSPDVQEDMRVATRARMHRATGERAQHGALHRIRKEEK